MLYVRGSSVTSISAVTINAGAQSTVAITANATGLELWDQVDVVVTMASSVTTAAPWALYLVPDTVDDANSPGLTTPPASIYLVAQWPTQTGTSAQRMTAHAIALPPGEFTYILYNGTGTNSAATSCSLARRPYHVA